MLMEDKLVMGVCNESCGEEVISQMSRLVANPRTTSMLTSFGWAL